MIKTVKISKVNIGDKKSGENNGKEWVAWPVGICINKEWHNAFLFDKDFVDELGASIGEEMTLDFYTEEYQGKDQYKFKKVSKDEIFNIKLGEQDRRIEALEIKVFGKAAIKKPSEETKAEMAEGHKAQNKPKFSPLVQAKWDEFDKYLTDTTMDQEIYKTTREWLDGLKDPTTKQLVENLSKLNEKLNPKSESKYAQHHESLITACCNTLKITDRLSVIQTLDIMVKKWGIEGTEELSDTSENQCFNLLEEFDKQQVAEQDDNLPY